MDRDQNRRWAEAERPWAPAVGALVLAVLVSIGLVAAAQASSGGIGASGGATAQGSGASGSTATDPSCPNAQLGRRTLKLGDCGGDVATLNWILKAKDYGSPPLAREFEDSTRLSVEDFQDDAGLVPDGIVDSQTTGALVNAMAPQRATWYGPGFFGNRTACGQRFTRRTRGVAHRTLPCGTRVVLRYRGRFVRTRVIDRGPFANGAKWDLAQATARELGFEYTDDVRVAKLATRPAP